MCHHLKSRRARHTASSEGSKSKNICSIETWGDPANLEVETHLCVDVVNKATWTFPCIPQGLDSSVSSYTLARSPDRVEQIISSDIDDIDDNVGEYMRRSVASSVRLLADVLKAQDEGFPSFAAGCLEKVGHNLTEQWLNVHPGVPKSRTLTQ